MPKKTDIVLIKPNNQKKLYQDLSKDFSGIEPPLWLILTAAYLRERNLAVEVIDAEAENLDFAETVQRTLKSAPLLAAVIVSGTNPSASTTSMCGAGKLLDEFKRAAPQIPTALSGLHPSALPERTTREEKADFVIVGEGFTTFEELLHAFKKGKSPKDDFAINGLWYKKDGKIISNPRAANVKELGSLPMPAWDLLPMEKYRAHNWHCFDDVDKRSPYAVVYTSLGCPFNCSFCCINSIFGKPGIRHRPPEKVAEEIDHLVKRYKVRNIKILDELFVSKPSHVEEFCERVSALGHDLNFWVYGRVDTVNENLLVKMKRAGINWIAYGIEAGSKKVRDGVSKGRFEQEQVYLAVDAAYKTDMHIVGNYIFGLPEDDLGTMEETLALAKELNCEYANLYCAMAYPGSRLYDDAVRQNIPLPTSWSGFAQLSEDCLPLPTKYLSSGEVLRFRDKAFDEYYANPRYLQMIDKKFGAKTVQNIKHMCSVKLKRNYYDRDDHVRFESHL